VARSGDQKVIEAFAALVPISAPRWHSCAVPGQGCG
jgi:hypothetical protein